MSKKRKKSTPSSASNYFVRKSFDTDGVSTWAFISGMVTTLLVFFMTWSHFSTRTATAKVIKSVESAKSGEAAVSIEAKQFELVLESATPEQLNNILLGLNDWPRGSGVPIQIEANRRRVKIANQMLTKKLDQDQRELAIESKIDALSVIYGLDFLMKLKEPNVAETLRAAATEFLEDANPEIARTARLAKLKHDSFEIAKLDYRSDLDPIAEQITELLVDFPDDDLVHSTAKLIVNYYNKASQTGGLQNGVIVVSKLEKNAHRFKSPKVQKLIHEFSDEATMIAADYDQVFNDRWVNGSKGQKQLLEVSLNLISRPESGELVLEKVDRVAHWFEQINEYETAIQIYNEMLRSARKYQRADAAEIARSIAKNGLQRSELVNQTLGHYGAVVDGSILTPEAFEGKVVVVVFWSLHNRRSVDALKAIYKDGATWREKGIEIVGVCIDQQLGQELKGQIKSFRRIQFVVRDSDGRIPILESSPSSETPRAMLIDKNGKVVDVNVPILELKTEAEYLIALDAE